MSKKAKTTVKAAAAYERRMDRLACKIVSIVADQMTGDKVKLYAYGGIEASRSVRKLLLRTKFAK